MAEKPKFKQTFTTQSQAKPNYGLPVQNISFQKKSSENIEKSKWAEDSDAHIKQINIESNDKIYTKPIRESKNENLPSKIPETSTLTDKNSLSSQSSSNLSDQPRNSDKLFSSISTDCQTSSNSFLSQSDPKPTTLGKLKSTYHKFLKKTSQKISSKNNFLIRSATKIKSKLQKIANEIHPWSTVEEIDVLCINCYECVPLSQVNSHSKSCTKAKEESKLEVVNINEKIKKLLEAINNKISVLAGVKLIFFSKLQELAISAINCSDYPNTIINNIKNLMMAYPDIDETRACEILAYRLSNLVEQKTPFFPERMSLYNENAELKYEIEAESQKKELEKWKLRTNLLLNIGGNPLRESIEEIHSEIDPDEDLFSSSLSTIDAQPDSDSEDYDDGDEELDEDQIEKYFYAICLKKKLKSPQSRPSKDISIADLYKKCQKENIEFSQWEDFIDQNLV
ncbi:unnamed protein product [Blepharisma stoltei]|uniref:Uncharacterized protein n=1 Tax=Blepharisma stoltei TaxID=1481888 RepID=A0AAU9JS10_9CILI|nr:unnamed protein product [Blepharisma stoltei]